MPGGSSEEKSGNIQDKLDKMRERAENRPNRRTNSTQNDDTATGGNTTDGTGTTGTDTGTGTDGGGQNHGANTNGDDDDDNSEDEAASAATEHASTSASAQDPCQGFGERWWENVKLTHKWPAGLVGQAVPLWGRTRGGRNSCTSTGVTYIVARC